jgi:hypothetical protein
LESYCPALRIYDDKINACEATNSRTDVTSALILTEKFAEKVTGIPNTNNTRALTHSHSQTSTLPRAQTSLREER